MGVLFVCLLVGGPAAAVVPPFVDTTGHPFAADIEWLRQREITLGCGSGRFCPDTPVSRDQMASFLARALALPPSGTDAFSDDAGSVYESDINRLAASRITSGCADGRYCPGGLVTRQEMASFLARALRLPQATLDYFIDDAGSPHEDDINRLAAVGVTNGCAGGHFCPAATVTRGQMAAFLHRALEPATATPPPPLTPVPTPPPTTSPVPGDWGPPLSTIRDGWTPDLPLPDKLQPITDPVLGTTVTRIGDAGQRHAYSRIQPWSPSEKYLFLHYGGQWLLDGQTYAPIRQLSTPYVATWVSDSEMVGTSGNQLVRYNVETLATDTLHTFAVNVSLGEGEGAPSTDFRYWALQSGGNEVYVYDRTTDAVISTAVLGAHPNWVTMSDNGTYVMVGFSTGGSGRARGRGCSAAT